MTFSWLILLSYLLRVSCSRCSFELFTVETACIGLVREAALIAVTPHLIGQQSFIVGGERRHNGLSNVTLEPLLVSRPTNKFTYFADLFEDCFAGGGP